MAQLALTFVIITVGAVAVGFFVTKIAAAVSEIVRKEMEKGNE